MNEYLDKCCGECGRRLSEDDDIAVCPECGTPIHRACWTGKCPNEDKHAEGYDWKSENRADEARGKKRCSICGEEIGEDIIYCRDCGVPMHKTCYSRTGRCPNNHGERGEYSQGGDFLGDNPNVISFSSFEEFIDGMEKKPIRDNETGEELTCYGVRQKELINFLGKRHFSTPRLVTLFLRMANSGKRISFNFFAGILLPYYQFYQKVTGPAFILLLVNFILSLPYTIYQLRYFENYMSGSTEPILTAQFDSILSAFSVISFIIEVAVMLFWDYFYMKWSVNKILNMRDEYAGHSEEEYFEALQKAGNPKMKSLLLGIGAGFILSSIVYYLFTIGLI